MGALILLLAVPAFADLSLVQTVQSQTSRGEDGLFGKTWVEVSGRRMRMVSGFAHKLPAPAGGKIEAPMRIIQILDLDTTSLLLLEPGTKTFRKSPLSGVRYADSLHRRLRQDPPAFEVAESTVEVKEGSLRKKILDSESRHFTIRAKLGLRGKDGRRVAARMNQDVWVAPVAGGLLKGLLDLIAFEAAYRRVSGSAFTPLDYETYQIREAAAYLAVPPAQVERVIAQVKTAFAEVPGYALESSVSWWRQDLDPPPAPKRLPPPRPVRTFLPTGWVRPEQTFAPIRWNKPWRVIDRMFDKTGREWRPVRLKRPEFKTFENRLTETVTAVRREEAPAVLEDGRVPFYEIFSETAEFEFKDSLPASDFAAPAGYTVGAAP